MVGESTLLVGKLVVVGQLVGVASQSPVSKEPALVVEAAVAAHVSPASHPAEAFGVETFAPVACLAAAPALLPHADATVGSLQKVQHFDPAAVGFAPVVAAVVAVVVAVAKGG